MANDAKILTDQSTKEVPVAVDAALTDYILVIDPNTGKVTRQLLSVIQTLVNT